MLSTNKSGVYHPTEDLPSSVQLASAVWGTAEQSYYEQHLLMSVREQDKLQGLVTFLHDLHGQVLAGPGKRSKLELLGECHRVEE